MTLLEEIDWAKLVPVASAVVAAGAAVAIAIISTRSQRSARVADETGRRKLRSADFLRRQLDGLYGEMFMLRSTSRRLWSRLDEGDTGFRLIDHITEIKAEASERRRSRVEQILVINNRLAALIETHASLLVELPPPESFMAFLDHQRALETLWQLGVDADPAEEEPSFPRSLDTDIDLAISTIKARLADIEG